MLSITTSSFSMPVHKSLTVKEYTLCSHLIINYYLAASCKTNTL